MNSNVEELFLKEFTYTTPENSFKQTIVHPEPGVWNWDRVDAFIDFANSKNIEIRAHGPIGPQSSTWAKEDSRTVEELTQIYEEFMIELCKKINNESINKYFRTHTHSLGKVVSGWKISNGKDWNLIGKKSPKEPQMFYPLADPELTFTKGDILAARCTMVIFVIYSNRFIVNCARIMSFRQGVKRRI